MRTVHRSELVQGRPGLLCGTTGSSVQDVARECARKVGRLSGSSGTFVSPGALGGRDNQLEAAVRTVSAL